MKWRALSMMVGAAGLVAPSTASACDFWTDYALVGGLSFPAG